MARYSTIAVSHAHAARARFVADHLGMPVGAFISELIDQHFEHEIGHRPSIVTATESDLVIALGDDHILIPSGSGPSFSAHLRKIADHGGAFMDADTEAMVSIGRQGSAVVIETSSGRKIRHTLGEAAAKRLADEIAAYAVPAAQ